MSRELKKTIHYVDNKKFLDEMLKSKETCKEFGDDKKSFPSIPDYIGECFMKIAERLSYRPNFVNYAFRDDMVADGIENCVQYAYNFNPERSNNPFSYFTQIIYYAFIRRIQKEKKHLYIKYKAIHEKSLLSDNVELSKHGEDFNQTTISEDQKAKLYKFIENFEESKNKKSKIKTKTASNSLAKFTIKS
jgi:hypothetical protein